MINALAHQPTLRACDVVTHFQPILSARRRSIIGLEALARAASPAVDTAAGPLFKMARDTGTLDEVDRLCRQEAVRRFAALAERPSDLVLFLNFRAPGAVAPAEITAELKALVVSAGLEPSGVAVEILEPQIDDMRHLQTLVGLLRAEGFLIALDDMGSGHSNLDRIPILRPDLLKIDRALVERLDADHYKRGTFKSLIDLSRKIGALVIAEGIETEDEALVALELGADMMQGFWLGAPDKYESARDQGLAAACDRVELLAMRFRSHIVQTIFERRAQHQQFSAAMDQIIRDLTHAEEVQFDRILTSAVVAYSRVECAYVLDRHGIQVSDTLCRPDMRVRTGGTLFRPAPRGADHSLKEYYYVLTDVELQRYTTDPYVSLASGSISQTISLQFRSERTSRLYVLCIDVLCD